MRSSGTFGFSDTWGTAGREGSLLTELNGRDRVTARRFESGALSVGDAVGQRWGPGPEGQAPQGGRVVGSSCVCWQSRACRSRVLHVRYMDVLDLHV